MVNYLLTNIGNRDIKQLIGSKFFLEDSKKLFESNNFDHVELTILDSVIELIGSNDLKVFLFVTKQSNGHNKDTYYAGRIIEKVISKQYKIPSDNILLHHYDKNPFDYDSLMDFYKTNSPEKEEKSIYYVSITSGIPSMNYSLLFSSVEKYGGNLRCVYKPENDEPKLISFPDHILKSYRKKIFDDYVKNKFYGLATKIGRKYSIVENWMLKELEARHHEQMFNFSKALEIYREIFEDCPTTEKDFFESKIRDLELFEKDLSIGDVGYFSRFKSYIVRLVDLILLDLDRGSYVYFIAKVFRLRESYLRFLFEMVTKCSTDKVDGEFRDFVRWVEENKDVKNILKESGLRFEPSVRVLSKCLKLIKEDYKEYSDFFDLLNTVKNYEKLDELRHKSILAHGFRGVSRDDIENKMGKSLEEVNKDWKNFVDKLKSLNVC